MKAKKIELGLNSRLKLNDWEIREHISSFAYLDKEGNIKQKKRSFTPINVPKKSRLKGLKLDGINKHDTLFNDSLSKIN